MAAPVYSTCFVQEKGLSSNAVYAVPPGFVAVMRDIDLYGNVVADGDVFVQGAQGQTIWWVGFNVGERKVSQWSGRQVFQPLDTIIVNPQLGPLDAIDITISGYLLTLP
jgi:hypothetical protein